jgi:hypothetical protein
MTDRPIIFSAPMIRALLNGRKTQTRRILKAVVRPAPAMDAVNPKNTIRHPAPYLDAYCSDRKTAANSRGMSTNWCWWTRDDRQCLPTFRVGYAPGDRLWVRENWQTYSTLDNDAPSALTGLRVWYSADDGNKPQSKVRPSIHMPRWASRLTLTVTGVKVQRLNDISREDAIAEGIVEDDGDIPNIWYCPGGSKVGVKRLGATPQEAFRHFWEANPWIVAITFNVRQSNIDALQEAA